MVSPRPCKNVGIHGRGLVVTPNEVADPGLSFTSKDMVDWDVAMSSGKAAESETKSVHAGEIDSKTQRRRALERLEGRLVSS